MKINLSHAFGTIELKTPNNSATDLVELKINIIAISEKIKKYLDSEIRKELEESSGFDGHTFMLSAVTNLDLSAAVRFLPSFKLLGIDPQELKYELLPDNVQN